MCSDYGTRGEIFEDDFITNSLLSVTAKESEKYLAFAEVIDHRIMTPFMTHSWPLFVPPVRGQKDTVNN